MIIKEFYNSYFVLSNFTKLKGNWTLICENLLPPIEIEITKLSSVNLNILVVNKKSIYKAQVVENNPTKIKKPKHRNDYCETGITSSY